MFWAHRANVHVACAFAVFGARKVSKLATESDCGVYLL